MDPKIINILPGLDIEELNYVGGLISNMEEDKQRAFASLYLSKRRDSQMILLLTLVGFLGFAGIQRFLVNQIGMGIIYFLTGGLCLIGTIVDLVNYKKLTFEYNQKMAQEALAVVNM